MKIQERYAVARSTSDLSIDERSAMAASDVLMAAGLSAQEHETALALWGVTFQGKTQAKNALVEMLARDLASFMIRARLRGDPKAIAREVIAWHLHGVCRPCNGLGYEITPGTPSLSDRLCKSCHGTKKVSLPRTEAHDWLSDRIGRLMAIAAGRMMRKLATDTDLG